MAVGYQAPPISRQFTDDNGDPLSTGYLYSYAAGGSTPLPVKSDHGLTTNAANPLPFNSAGRVTFYVPAGVAYRFVVKDALGGSVISDEDYVIVPEPISTPAPTNIPVGGMIDWTGAVAPSGWLICDGALVSRTTYAALFAIVGTASGVGDGATTFALPDLRQRVTMGVAAAGTGSTRGGTGGTIDHTHTVAAVADHNHGGNTGTAGGHDHGGSTGNAGGHDHGGATGAGGDHDHGGSTGEGSDDAHNDYQLGGGTGGADQHHTHGISGSGTHTHTIANQGDHNHSISNSGDHQHTIADGGGHNHGGATGTGNQKFQAWSKIVYTGV